MFLPFQNVVYHVDLTWEEDRWWKLSAMSWRSCCCVRERIFAYVQVFPIIFDERHVRGGRIHGSAMKWTYWPTGISQREEVTNAKMRKCESKEMWRPEFEWDTKDTLQMSSTSFSCKIRQQIVHNGVSHTSNYSDSSPMNQQRITTFYIRSFLTSTPC